MPDTSQKRKSPDREREETLDEFHFGEIAVWGELISRETLEEVLAELAAVRASGKTAPRLSEALVRRGDLTDEQVRRVLKVQLQRLPAERHLVFGQIAEAHKFILPEENRRALDIQAREILAGGQVRPLPDILVEMGAMDREAADAVISYQAQGDATHMSKARKARVEQETGVVSGPESPPRPDGKPRQMPRPVFLPRGWLGFVADNSIWLAIAAAVLFALALTAVKGRVVSAVKVTGSGNTEIPAD